MPQLVTTGDGSHTLYIPELNEHYHSYHGAIQESKHVFIEMGLKAIPEEISTIHILEAGFGTGLNALLTLLYSERNQRKIHYTGIELYPLSDEIVKYLNYASLLHEEGATGFFRSIHSAAWNAAIKLTDNFTLEKLRASLTDSDFQEKYHLIYFDAFAPEKQPELWTTDLFRRMYHALLPGGMLVTYCSKGQVRRNMLEAGFQVEKLSGPPGKREMLRARK